MDGKEVTASNINLRKVSQKKKKSKKEMEIYGKGNKAGNVRKDGETK